MRKATAYFATTRADSKLPAGTYRLVTEEEGIPGLSFVAFRRTATLLALASGRLSLLGHTI